MIKQWKGLWKLVTILMLAVVMLVTVTLAQAAPVASITHVSGPLLVRKADGSSKALAIGSKVDTGDTVITEKRTYARLKFTDGSEVVLKPSTLFKVEKYSFDQAKPREDAATFNMIKGGLRTVTGQIGKRGDQDAYRMKVPTATIGIRGTIFTAIYVEPGEQQTAERLPEPVLLAFLDLAPVMSDALPFLIADAGTPLPSFTNLRSQNDPLNPPVVMPPGGPQPQTSTPSIIPPPPGGVENSMPLGISPSSNTGPPVTPGPTGPAPPGPGSPHGTTGLFTSSLQGTITLTNSAGTFPVSQNTAVHIPGPGARPVSIPLSNMPPLTPPRHFPPPSVLPPPTMSRQARQPRPQGVPQQGTEQQGSQQGSAGDGSGGAGGASGGAGGASGGAFTGSTGGGGGGGCLVPGSM